jgi:protein-S-isoprenylcysteine O-methyltransferase Ste14
VAGSKKEHLRTSLEVGVCAAAALGFVNRAAHQGDPGLIAMHGSLGVLAAFCAFRLAEKSPAGGRLPARHAAGVVGALAALLAAATYFDGAVLWDGGSWLGALGALGALGCAVAARPGLAGAVPGGEPRGPYKVVRQPAVPFFILACLGVLLVRYSGLNAAILGAAILLVPVSALLEERARAGEPEHLRYTGDVRWMLLPGIV